MAYLGFKKRKAFDFNAGCIASHPSSLSPHQTHIVINKGFIAQVCLPVILNYLINCSVYVFNRRDRKTDKTRQSFEKKVKVKEQQKDIALPLLKKGVETYGDGI